MEPANVPTAWSVRDDFGTPRVIARTPGTVGGVRVRSDQSQNSDCTYSSKRIGGLIGRGDHRLQYLLDFDHLAGSDRVAFGPVITFSTRCRLWPWSRSFAGWTPAETHLELPSAQLTAPHRDLPDFTRLRCNGVQHHFGQSTSHSLSEQIRTTESIMTKLRFDPVNYQFYYRCSLEDGGLAKAAGFRWDALRRRYYTIEPRVAAVLANRGDDYVKLLLADALEATVQCK